MMSAVGITGSQRLGDPWLRRRWLGSLSHQFAAGVALIFGLALAGVGAVALLMFVSAHDAYLLAQAEVARLATRLRQAKAVGLARRSA